MHWAAHGHTAAEIVYERADNSKKNMGLLSFKGAKPTKKEIEVAKNYLNEDELNVLNRMVTAYLEIAELQAMNQVPMYMKDWIERIDDFLKMTGKDILTNAGVVSHKQALQKANLEYEKYKEQTRNELTKVEKDFIEHIENTAKELKRK